MLILLWTIFLLSAASAQIQLVQDLEKLEEKSNANREAILHLMHAIKDQEKVMAEMRVGVVQSLTASSEIKNLLENVEDKITKKLVKEIQQLKAQDLEKLATDTEANREVILESSKKQENAFREMKNYVDQAELGLGSALKSLDQKFIALKTIVEMGKCKMWNEKLSGLELKKLDTGVYHFSKSWVSSWQQADDFCKSRGMHLAWIESEKEMKLLDANIYSNSWVGASDMEREPGQFYWQDDSLVDAALIGKWKIHGAGKSTCIFLEHKTDRNLREYECSYTFYLVCEVGAEFMDCV